MANKDIITGWAVGLLSGTCLHKLSEKPVRMKISRKGASFYNNGKKQYEKIQTAKAQLSAEAKKRTIGKGNYQMNQEPVNNNQQTTPNKGSRKLPIAILTGALIGGAFILIKDSDERKRLLDKTRSKKDSVSDYASEVKEDPMTKKDSLVSKVKQIVTVANEAVSTIQEVYNNQGKEIQEKVKDIKEESEEIIETAKEAGDELQDVGDQAKDVKEELKSSEEENKQADEKVVEVNPRV